MLNWQGNNATDRGLFLQGTLVTSVVLALPFLSLEFVWLQFLAPLPIFYYLSVCGYRQGGNIIASAILVCGIMAAIKLALPALLFAVTMLPVGIVLAIARQNNRPPQLAALYACLALLGGWLFWAVSFGILNNVNPFLSMVNGLEGGLDATYQALSSSSEIPPDRLLEIETAFRELKTLLPRILPGLLLTSIIVTACINLIIGQWIIRRRDTSLIPWEPFSRWVLPEHLVFALIGAGFMAVMPIALVKTVGINLLFVFGIIYFFQGLAILTCILEKWAVPQLLRGVIYLLLVIQAYGIIMLVIAGIADVWADFRKFKAKPVKEE